MSESSTNTEKQVQALADLTLAMKRSAAEMNQETLNQSTHALEVYEYLGRTYIPTERCRIQDIRKRIVWLEKGDFWQKRIESWLLRWKDAGKKLGDMRLKM